MEKFLAVVRSFTSSSSKVGIPLGQTLSLIGLSWTVTFNAVSALEEVDYFANMSHFCSLVIIYVLLYFCYTVQFSHLVPLPTRWASLLCRHAPQLNSQIYFKECLICESTSLSWTVRSTPNSAFKRSSLLYKYIMLLFSCNLCHAVERKIHK